MRLSQQACADPPLGGLDAPLAAPAVLLRGAAFDFACFDMSAVLLPWSRDLAERAEMKGKGNSG